jgi:CRISPR/Cas system-associated exonuclease Cas4 (RecB family)
MLWRSTDEKEKYLGAGYKICQEFFERNEGVPFSHVLVEQYFMVTLTNEKSGKGYALQGYIDRIELKGAKHAASFVPDDLGKAIKNGEDGELWVIDYKSGYKPTPAAALDLDTQFSCYDLAVEILYPFRERKFAIENVRDGSLTLTARGEGERRVLRERIFTIGKAIEKEKFPLASNMYKCSSCSYLKHCNSLQRFAHQKGIHPEDLMRASSPIPKRSSKVRSMFEWKDGELKVVDEKRLHSAEKLRTRPVQLSFFIDEEELAEIEEELTVGAGKPFAHEIIETAVAWEESSAVIDSME